MKQESHTLHYESYGTGQTVLFLHGFLTSSAYWDRVTNLVSKNHRVIAIDLLGFGKSPKPRRSKYDYADHIRSINKTLESAGVNEPFILVGHSMGALISLRYANMYPGRVENLILTNMPVMIGSEQVKQQILKKNFVYRLGLTPYTHRIMWGTVKSLYRLKLLPKTAVASLTKNTDNVFKHSPLSRLRSFRQVIMHAKTEVDLAVVSVKTTVLSGIDDKKVYIDNLVHNIELSPHVVMRNFQTGHHIPLIMPEIVAQTIEN